MIVCSFVHKEATFFTDYNYVMYPSFVYNLVFIYLFIYFYTGPRLIAVFITEMVILFKHVIITCYCYYYYLKKSYDTCAVCELS